MTGMTGDLMRGSLEKLRAVLIRGLAVVAVVATYAVTSLGTQVATTLGLSAVALTSTTNSAEAGWWGRGRYRRGYVYGGYSPYRRRWYRRRWY
jgi:hypothetical protein